MVFLNIVIILTLIGEEIIWIKTLPSGKVKHRQIPKMYTKLSHFHLFKMPNTLDKVIF
jgi:hypothetical protein